MLKYKMEISSDLIKNKFINFFVEKGHFFHPHSPLAPSESDTTLFTIAGMKQFSDYFLGHKQSPYKRIVTCQPCLRTNDLENVGKTKRHHSFFEMLGNFTFGDYFKEDAINFAYEFLVKHLQIDFKFLYFTVFHTDLESYNIWCNLVGESRVLKMETDDNFWSAGNLGPCGPCTEIYFDTTMGKTRNLNDFKESILTGSDEFLEIWNLVFMEYEKTANGLVELKNKCVDTGMGLERITSVYEKVFDNYLTSSFKPIVEKINTEAENIIASKIITDHLKAIVFLLGEGLLPSHDGRGYILRNLIRRCCLYVQKLSKYVDLTWNNLGNYNKDFVNKDEIIKIIDREEESFAKTLEKAKKMLENKENINEQDVFMLYETYGLPLEITGEFLQKREINIDWQIVEDLKQKHSEISKQKIQINFDQVTKQLDYDTYECTAKVLFLQLIEENGFLSSTNSSQINSRNQLLHFILVSDQSCFYGKGGGQEGDRGEIIFKNNKIEVYDTIRQKISNDEYILLHFCKLIDGEIKVGDSIEMKIDRNLRQSRTRAHSGTHLFVDYFIKNHNFEVCGSFVDEDYFRIDLNIGNEKNLKEIAQNAIEYVKNIIAKSINSLITYENFQDVKDITIKEHFNYGSVVRIIDFPGCSKQLCGGTHVKNTSEIENIAIKRITAKQAGVRRIECFTGQLALDLINNNKNQDENKKIESKNENKFEIISLTEFAKFVFIELNYYNSSFHNKMIEKYGDLPIVIIINNEKTSLILSNINDSIISIVKAKFSLNGGGKFIVHLGSKELIFNLLIIAFFTEVLE